MLQDIDSGDWIRHSPVWTPPTHHEWILYRGSTDNDGWFWAVTTQLEEDSLIAEIERLNQRAGMIIHTMISDIIPGRWSFS